VVFALSLIALRGFTLIELLIVVAIIAILDAIAVPNFLEAQLRAKVSRAKSDMRSVATALEAYRVDHIRKKMRERPASEMAAQGEDFAQWIEALFDKQGMWKNPPGAWSGNPRHELERKEFRVIFESCLGAMPERLANAFVMHEVEQLKGDRVCQVLDITSTNLWTMLHRTRMRLRECLERRWGGGSIMLSCQEVFPAGFAVIGSRPPYSSPYGRLDAPGDVQGLPPVFTSNGFLARCGPATRSPPGAS
jgi:prepilin-type N-terminal cleavage/methylation domain-containing protein